MAKNRAINKTDKQKKEWPEFVIHRLGEGAFILILTALFFIVLALATYSPSDPGWSQNSYKNPVVLNAGGQVGAYMADALYFVFGKFACLLPLCCACLAWFALKNHKALRTVNRPELMVRASGFLFLVLGICGLLGFDPHRREGGVIGHMVAENLTFLLSQPGATLMLSAMFFAGVTWLTGFSWLVIMEHLGSYTLSLLRFFYKGIPWLMHRLRKLRPKQKTETAASIPAPSLIKKERTAPVLIAEKLPMPPLPAKPVVKETPPPPPPSFSSSNASNKSVQPTTIPSLSLLDKGLPGKPMGGYSHQELENVSRELEQHLLDFGIQADVVAVHPGPVITRFELQLAAGIKVSKLTALAKDLARSLSVISVRVVEVIPGKTVVGLELPNQNREMVRLSTVLCSEVYQQAFSPLTMVLGVDIAGHPMVVDLGKMPHLLVAGTTGSGKSVGINAMILSLLFKATPDQVRLIMVDPKMLELSVYDGIPHLLTPVVTDMKEAASALRWSVAEMERRYKLMAALGVRNLASYNVKVSEAAANGTPLTDPLWKPVDGMDETAPELQTLPYIVIIIDELADMMMVVGKKVEQLIARIAQKARAAGIHLILATQRPSVDVLTGLIKSNIPTRISFQVSSKIDSRTILDQQGAEQLLGHGDMLFLAPGTGAPLRVHGAFVGDEEVHRIADDWRARGVPEYIESITLINSDNFEGGDEEGGEAVEEADPLFDQAVEFVVQTRKASISAVQRRLKIGYNRAARIVEEMERVGIVGPLDGGYRDVLVANITEE